MRGRARIWRQKIDQAEYDVSLQEDNAEMKTSTQTANKEVN